VLEQWPYLHSDVSLDLENGLPMSITLDEYDEEVHVQADLLVRLSDPMPMSDTCPLKYADRTSSWECKCNASTKYGKVANHPCRSKKDRSRATQKLTNHYKGRDKGGRWVRGLHPALAAAQEASSHGAIGAS